MRSASVLVGLDLAVDLGLDHARFADVGEPVLGLSRVLEDEVTGADDPLEEPLVEHDGVDAVQSGLDALLAQHAVPVDGAVGGEGELGGEPPGEPIRKKISAPPAERRQRPRGPSSHPVVHADQDGDTGDDGQGSSVSRGTRCHQWGRISKMTSSVSSSWPRG